MRFYHITLWYRYSVRKQRFVFNHLEYGWSPLKKPVPMFKDQQSWKKQIWMKEFTFMDVESKAVA